MTSPYKRTLPAVAMLTAVMIASMTVLSTGAAADRETATIQSGTYLALYFDIDEGAEFEFTVTSTVEIYVAMLDDDNYQLYAAGADINAFLFLTNSPVTSVSSTVEVPEDGRYYLVIENSESQSAASVTIDYELHGSIIPLLLLVIVIVIGGVVGGIVMMRRNKAKAAAQQQPAPRQDELTKPPNPPMQ